MSSSYHPETDGLSKQTNKTVVQLVRYHVNRCQQGWKKCLPRIRFAIMNSVNASTGFSGFQLRLGRSPRLIPPFVTIPQDARGPLRVAAETAVKVIEQLREDTWQAIDNLTAVKIRQAHAANKKQRKDWVLKEGDKAYLQTFHRVRDYKDKSNKPHKCAAKFFPVKDGPWTVTHANPERSSYTLDVPQSHKFNTFRISELAPFVPNDPVLFPSRELERPGPVIGDDGLEEHFVQEIIDEKGKRDKKQFLVQWRGYGPEDDTWLKGEDLNDCEALDVWEESQRKARGGMATRRMKKVQNNAALIVEAEGGVEIDEGGDKSKQNLSFSADYSETKLTTFAQVDTEYSQINTANDVLHLISPAIQ